MQVSSEQSKPNKNKSNPVEEVSSTIIRFAGDSGDGMQLTGSRFASTSAILGEDVMTLAEYPAEIRAPAGTIAGVSSFQLMISGDEVLTTGDYADVLIAMNPAALNANLHHLRKGGILICNQNAFTDKNLQKAEYFTNPLEDGSLEAYQVFSIELTRLTQEALKDLDVDVRQPSRSKNFFALGLVCWLFNHSTKNTEEWVKQKFKGKDSVILANTAALKAGNSFGDMTEQFATTYSIKETQLKRKTGTYRYMSGNMALSSGLIAAGQKSGLRLFMGGYPITPASDILHELSRHRQFPITTFQAEDEMAAIGAAVGASFAGALAVTATSGPGFALKSEFMNLAVITELPLIVVDVQRGGPSTGLPTKLEQSDLLQALWGRNGESPVIVLAPQSPGDCFYIALEAARLATKYMSPVVILSDGYIANGSEPWRIPTDEEIPDVPVQFHSDPENFQLYGRDEKTLARPWAKAGTPGLAHTLGGLEKQDLTGAVDQSPENHGKMVGIRAKKIANVAQDIPLAEVQGKDDAELLVIGWGSTYGSITKAVAEMSAKGEKVASLHLRHLNPFPRNLEEIFSKYKKFMVVENNLGQLCMKLRADFLIPAKNLNKVEGVPFKISEIQAKIKAELEAN